MVRRTRKRSKNKKGGADTSFTGKFLQGANDIGDGLKAARDQAKKTYTGAQYQLQVFNAAAEDEKRRLAQGGDGKKISLFEKNPQALLKPRRPDFPKPVTPTIIGRGGKRKTRRKKRRKNKKRKTKKRRRKRKTKKKRRR